MYYFERKFRCEECLMKDLYLAHNLLKLEGEPLRISELRETVTSILNNVDIP